MESSGTYILSKFDSDKLDTESVSGLSLFLYEQTLVVIANDEQDGLCGVHIYNYQVKDSLHQIIQDDSLINSPNTFGRLYVHNRLFSLLPASLFDPSQCITYLKLHADIDQEKIECFYEKIELSEMVVVGGAEKTLLTLFDQALPDLEVTPGVFFHLSFLMDLTKDTAGDEIVLMPFPGGLYLGAFVSGSLHVFNQFPVSEETSFLKYLAAVVEQVGMDQEAAQLTVVGGLEHVFSSEDQLKTYFAHVRTVNPNSTLSYLPGVGSFTQSGLLESVWKP